jgi:predicted dehydrogenase
MLTIARRKRLLIFENFQFQTHTQWQWIKNYWDSGKLGRIHLIRTTFGFPPHPDDNFRWNRELGGGALLDTGAYVAKASQLLLGHELQLVSSLQWTDTHRRVDTYGEVTFVHPHSGVVVQGAFGFDYFYQCRLEILGTQGKLHTGRIFTAPPDHTPVITVEHPDGCEEITLSTDNHYLNMWQWFVAECHGGSREAHWAALADQARLLNQIQTQAQTFTTI